VSGGANKLWPADVMFDGEGQMFLHNGWRRFARSHAIDVGHFDVFKYDGHRDFSVKVFDEIMCCRHYHSDEDTTGQRQDKDDVVSTMFLLCFKFYLLKSANLYATFEKC
jgi:hypothetical protein